MATKIQIRSCVISGNHWSFFRGWEGVAVHGGRMSHGKWKKKLAAAWLGTQGGFVDEHKQTETTHSTTRNLGFGTTGRWEAYVIAAQ